MEVIVDSREGPLFEALKTKKTKEWITTGDVAIKQNGKIKVIIERKTLSDMRGGARLFTQGPIFHPGKK